MAKAVAVGEEVVEPGAALDGVEADAEELDPVPFHTGRGLFGDANLFAVAGVVH